MTSQSIRPIPVPSYTSRNFVFRIGCKPINRSFISCCIKFGSSIWNILIFLSFIRGSKAARIGIVYHTLYHFQLFRKSFWVTKNKPFWFRWNSSCLNLSIRSQAGYLPNIIFKKNFTLIWRSRILKINWENITNITCIILVFNLNTSFLSTLLHFFK